MKQAICPIDKKPCERDCPDRYQDGLGCILTTAREQGAQIISLTAEMWGWRFGLEGEMGAKSQRKGRAAELELSRILQEYGYPVEAGRAQSYGEVPDLTGLPGIHVECKRTEALRLSEWMAQAERDSQRFGDGAPAVFFRRSRSPWMVTMKLSDWIKIYQKGEQQHEKQ